ncbi:MAG TPA: M20 family metallopeptidase [Saprospiraceae bacterium]|nr:M20 family metallopeptidase [Saprospiraceae bacterium]
MNTDIIYKIKSLAKQFKQDAVSIRRHLHQNPELSFEEKETASYIQKVLDQLGISYTNGWAGYGIVATIKGSKPGPRRAFRADMDALPIQEESNVPYKSIYDGKMHACGHDVHTASLLGAIKILQEMKEYVSGSIDFIFQPGEEKHPGGASIMLQEKALGVTLPEYILAQHVFPSLPAGKVGIKSGQFMASADELYITIKGKGGHAATPHLAIDTILISAHIVTALQQIISRNVDPVSPSVLTIGKINSTGGATNIIPEEVKLEGTFRALDESWRFKAHDLIKTTCEHIATAMGGTCEVNILVGYPSLINDATITRDVKSKMTAYLGAENIIELPVRLTAEDFAYFTQVTPSCFYRLGTGNTAKGITSQVHTPTFDIDEDALEVGIGLAAYLLI